MDEVDVGGIKLTPLYAAYIEDYSTAVMADLHIGYESALHHEGVSIPKYQKKIIMERIVELLDRYELERVIIDGDFKHEFGKNLRQEWREVEEILSFLAKKTDVVIVRGNHDNFLKTIAYRYNVPVVEEYWVGDVKIVHGDKMVKKEGKIIMGHEHPSIGIRDKVGAMVKLPCYLVSNGIFVLPALSPLATGTDVVRDENFLSPILREENIDEFEIYAINHDEILYFSRIKDLKKII